MVLKQRAYCSTDCECLKVCEESINSFESLITDNTCAILVEPIQGEGGIITPKAGWLKQLEGSMYTKQYSINSR